VWVRELDTEIMMFHSLHLHECQIRAFSIQEFSSAIKNILDEAWMRRSTIILRA